MEKFDKLTKELKLLAESILNGEQGQDIESGLLQARELYEKFLILSHLNQEMESTDMAASESIEAPSPFTAVVTEETIEIDISEDIAEEISVDPGESEEDDAPLSLNDLFVPTFDGIKEDMSQKEEFKDTISLDETENLFQTKKEEPRQLSLNDKLVGSSIQVGLNDRIAFVNKLFNFSQSDFNKVLSRLNDCKTRDEALNYFQYQVKPNYNWKGKEDLEERLIVLIERKYM
jgi:hypothetical protein